MNGGGLYKVTGTVQAPDGSTYDPVFYGDWWAAVRVRDAIVDGARARGETARVLVRRPDGSVWSELNESEGI